jgi:hypothetical protein
MNKKVLMAIGVLLSAGVTLSGAACWRTLRSGSFPERACEGERFSLTAAFVPGFDYAELRDTSSGTRALAASGTQCGRAKDREACEAALAAATSKEGWTNGSNGRMPGRHYVVATRGDEVLVVNGAALGLAAALAPIDSPVKAAAVASTARGIGVSCERSVRKAGAGFEVHLVTDSCFGPADEVIAVAPDGKLTVISEEHGPQTCMGQRGPDGRQNFGSWAARHARNMAGRRAYVETCSMDLPRSGLPSSSRSR